ncbi:MAG: Fur family transcriptional regulator [Burkholderiales bacterium]
MLNSVISSPVENQARQLLRAAGARITVPRMQILSALLQTSHGQGGAAPALSHHDVAEKLLHQGWTDHDLPDRVTLYRVLEWLVDQGLAHKMAGDDRVFRFSLNAGDDGKHNHHAHFQCLCCHRMFCLHENAQVQQALSAALPHGFKAQQVSASVKGQCAECSRKN